MRARYELDAEHESDASNNDENYGVPTLPAVVVRVRLQDYGGTNDINDQMETLIKRYIVRHRERFVDYRNSTTGILMQQFGIRSTKDSNKKLKDLIRNVHRYWETCGAVPERILLPLPEDDDYIFEESEREPPSNWRPSPASPQPTADDDSSSAIYEGDADDDDDIPATATTRVTAVTSPSHDVITNVISTSNLDIDIDLIPTTSTTCKFYLCFC